MAYYSESLADALSDWNMLESMFWILGSSTQPNPILPFVYCDVLHPMVFPLDTSFSDLDNTQLPGLCSFPLVTSDVVSTSALTTSICSSEDCSKRGTCYDLHDDLKMCDCENGYFGETCEKGK
jgi:hypothetical protein